MRQLSFALLFLLSIPVALSATISRQVNVTSNDTHIIIYDNQSLYFTLNRTSNFTDNTTAFNVQFNVNDSTLLSNCGDVKVDFTPVIPQAACNPTINVPPQDFTPFINALQSISTTCADKLRELSIQQPQTIQPVTKVEQKEFKWTDYWWVAALGLLVVFTLDIGGIKTRMFPPPRQDIPINNFPVNSVQQNFPQEQLPPPKIPDINEIMRDAKIMSFNQQVSDNRAKEYERIAKQKEMELQRMKERLVQQDAQMDTMKREEEEKKRKIQEIQNDMKKIKEEIPEQVKRIPSPIQKVNSNHDDTISFGFNP